MGDYVHLCRGDVVTVFLYDPWHLVGNSTVPHGNEFICRLVHSLLILNQNAGKELKMDDFKTVKEHAWSLPPGETRGVLVHVEETKYGKFFYYLDKTDGTYWYQSERTEKFNKEMKQKGKERRRCSEDLKNELRGISA